MSLDHFSLINNYPSQLLEGESMSKSKLFYIAVLFSVFSTGVLQASEKINSAKVEDSELRVLLANSELGEEFNICSETWWSRVRVYNVLKIDWWNLRVRCQYGETLLHRAVRYARHSGIAVALIGMGLDVNGRDSFKQTPLHIAAITQRIGMAQVLIDNNADVDARNIFGQTAFDLARQLGNQAMASFLMGVGGNR